jgi:hypothetical protein
MASTTGAAVDGGVPVALVPTVHPDSGRSSSITFRPDAQYEFCDRQRRRYATPPPLASSS